MSTGAEKHCIGLAGEYLVAGMMSLKGWIANLTSKNCPSFDVFAYNPEIDKNVNVQVKTAKNSRGFLVGLKHNELDRIEEKIKGPYVYVYIDDKNDNVRYFILSREEIINLIKDTDRDYYERRTTRAKATREDYLVAVLVDWLEKYEDKWDNLWK